MATPLNDWIDFDVDEAYAYVATSTTISRAPLGGDGSEAAVVAAANSGEVFDSILAGDGDHLLIASDQRIARVDKSGGTSVLLSAGPVYAMTADGSNAFFMRARPEGGDTCRTGSDLYSVPVTGGIVRHLVTDLGTCTSKLVQDANGVYWISGDQLSILKALK